jgi:hypothetical protein
MACRQSTALSELEFVHALMGRDEELTQCKGAVIGIELWSYKVHVLEEIFDSQVASDLLWDGFTGDGGKVITFQLCCAHWFDLAVLIELRAAQHCEPAYHHVAAQLLMALCHEAGWDPKELLNMVAWSRERLT